MEITISDAIAKEYIELARELNGELGRPTDERADVGMLVESILVRAHKLDPLMDEVCDEYDLDRG